MRFNDPRGVAADGSGNVYVADTSNQTIRKIVAATGEVTTLAGMAGSKGSEDGTGNAARLFSPSGITADGTGNLYVADGTTVRKVVVATGEVTTLAGGTAPGSDDGKGTAAGFYFPSGVAADGAGNLYVADTRNDTIRKLVLATRVVTTLAGMAHSLGSADGIGTAARFSGPAGIAADGAGNLYVADRDNHIIRKIVVASGEVSTLAGLAGTFGAADGTGSAARFYYPDGLTWDGTANLYVSDNGNHTVRKIVVATREVTTLAGEAYTSGNADGTGSAARFQGPRGVAADGSGTVYVADSGNDSVRRIVCATAATSTLAGLSGQSGVLDGAGAAARLNAPSGVAADGSGSLYVADTANHAIRKIVVATGEVTTLAGLAGTSGSADGTGNAARFRSPWGVAADASGNIYVADSDNATIRRVVIATGVVTTLAGAPGITGSTDGTGAGARFNFPTGLSSDGSGNLFVADKANQTIRKIVVATGEVTTLAGLAGSSGTADGVAGAARFSWPSGVALDSSGNLYVADEANSLIRKIVLATREVTTLAGSGQQGASDGIGRAAQFHWPEGVAVDGAGHVYVADGFNYTIRRISLATGAVTTVAGFPAEPGSVDGTGNAARFGRPDGIAVDASGTVYVADSVNNCIRRGTAASRLADSAVIDSSTGAAGQLRRLDTSPRTATRWLWEEIRRPSASAAVLSSTTIPNPTFTPDLPELYVFRLTATNDSGDQSITTVSLTATRASAAGPVSRLLPIVLDVSNGSAHYTTEATLSNNSSSRLTVSMTYTASLGAKQGSGTVTESLAPGEQKKIDDVLSYLRDKGLAIPSSHDQPSQGGTLLCTFQGNDGLDARLVSVAARTAALTSAPQPAGRAGLAYVGLLAAESSSTSLNLYGLRSSPSDRTNLAVFNTSAEPVTITLSLCSRRDSTRTIETLLPVTLPAYGWMQYNSADLFRSGFPRQWAVIERTSATGSFSAYAVINDSETNDGSFVQPAFPPPFSDVLTVPALVETPAFRSELTLVNRSTSWVSLALDYVESQTPALGSGGTMWVQLAPWEERIIPEAIDFLRSNGVDVGPTGSASYVGALRITVSGATAESVFAGVRTASQSHAGGQFGLFTPCVYAGQEASTEAFLYGLRADAENRTNVAVVNAGRDSDGPILLQLQVYDGDAGGAPKGEPLSVPLSPGHWAQPANFFKDAGVSNGWVRVTRMSGTAPWITYAVINDGGRPGERTGDGAYVPMVK